MSDNSEMRKVFEDRQKDIYQGSEELSSYPDGKYLSHYVRCDFDWFQAAWEHHQAKIKELESQLEQAKKDQKKYLSTLELARRWALGDKWRNDPQFHDDWKWYVAELDAAIKENQQ